MACENLSNYYPIVMKFSGYLLLYEDTSAVDFGPDLLIPFAGHAPNGGRTWKYWPASGPPVFFFVLVLI